jgi:hypothetical protein
MPATPVSFSLDPNTEINQKVHITSMYLRKKVVFVNALSRPAGTRQMNLL